MTFLRRSLVPSVSLVAAVSLLVGAPAHAESYHATPRTTASIRSIVVDNGPRVLHLSATQRANGSGVLAFEWAINVDHGKKREFTVYTYEGSSDVLVYDADFHHVACKGVGYTKKGRTATADIPKRCFGSGVDRLQVQVTSTYQRHVGRGECKTEVVPAHGYTPFLTTSADRRVVARPSTTGAAARRGC